VHLVLLLLLADRLIFLLECGWTLRGLAAAAILAVYPGSGWKRCGSSRWCCCCCSDVGCRGMSDVILESDVLDGVLDVLVVAE
jgi:hypothetical protein